MKKLLWIILLVSAIVYMKSSSKKPPSFIYTIIRLFKLDWFLLPDYTFFLNNNYNYYLENEITLNNWKILGKKYEKLIEWLDIKSKDVVDTIIRRIFLSKERKFNATKNLFSSEILAERKEIKKVRKNYKFYWYLPINYREDSVFYYQNWLKNLGKIDLVWKDIIDCGAFIWDSDLVFDKEIKNYNKIYCFEPSNTNYNLLLKTITKNEKQDKFVPIKKWVWDKNEILNISFWGSATSLINTKLKWKSESIEIVKLDDYIKENNLIPWLIKWDIEWFELESIKWAKQIISEFKPILLVSIYHTWKDFFEIKPLLESWDLWYKFKIVHNNPFHIFYETVLICYVDLV
jgi:FkbM family methyltransferase